MFCVATFKPVFLVLKFSVFFFFFKFNITYSMFLQTLRTSPEIAYFNENYIFLLSAWPLHSLIPS